MHNSGEVKRVNILLLCLMLCQKVVETEFYVKF